ncbi:hypothetical protein CG98_gp162 [Enterobacter phage PG7]|uniref:Anti-restriction nuclease n=1 Tax=Enterobacter phage PG7 TaxID=1455074 RepID=W6B2Z2_9CAUD|nr:hypothetical protein CG98_gp162 [Enterobacter phage PG7]AHI61183.1 hypothetical protein PG7_280 [Enterobacter phage PG7]
MSKFSEQMNKFVEEAQNDDLIETKNVNERIPEICFVKADWWDGRLLQRVIVCAANRFKLKDGGELVIPGTRHYSKDMALVLDQMRDKVVSDQVYGDDQGFVDQWGNYLTRQEALIVATHAGQINTRRVKSGPSDTLFSEDLY